MLKINNALKEIIQNDDTLKAGLNFRLLNLSQVAEFVRPALETRVKKNVKKSTLIMALSRLQKEMSDFSVRKKFSINNLSIYPDLCSFTFFSSQDVRKKVERIYKEVQNSEGYISVIQGTKEIAIIIDESDASLVKRIIKETPKHITPNLVSLNIRFDEKFYVTPGGLYQLFRQLAFQGINVFEVSSTFTEINIYIAQKDVRLAFDTFFNIFQQEKNKTASSAISKNE